MKAVIHCNDTVRIENMYLYTYIFLSKKLVPPELLFYPVNYVLSDFVINRLPKKRRGLVKAALRTFEAAFLHNFGP